MNLLSRLRVATLRAVVKAAITPLGFGNGWFTVVREAFAGAFQSQVTIDAPREVTAFSGVFACITKIASDISKMRMKLVQDQASGICVEIKAQSPYRAVLEKPNDFQNRIKFIQQWLASKLIWGNAYVLKQRDLRGIVTSLTVLDPQRVRPIVTAAGDVYYELGADNLAGLAESVTVPASEIIHDLMVPLWHPLVGVSPIYACGMSATMGARIQRNSTRFFQNASMVSGYLEHPKKIDDEEAEEIRRRWNARYGPQGTDPGGVAVLANGLKFTKAEMIPPEDAQLIQQLEWTIADVARCYQMPLYKVGGPIPANTSVEAINQSYYSECLQILIEDIELCLEEGLGLPRGYHVEFDLDGLLRMDTASMITAEAEAVKGGIKAPDESRRRLNLPPVPGGATPYLQQQNFSLAALAKRDALPNPFVIDRPTANPTPSPDGPPVAADPAATKALAVAQLRELLLERKAA